MDSNITVEEALYLMPSLTPVKVIFDSGCFFSGSKYKVLRQLSSRQKELKVSKMFNIMCPVRTVHFNREIRTINGHYLPITYEFYIAV